MNFYLKPKLFSLLKNYSKEQFLKDLIAGVIVAIIALPLSIALALASGVSPEKGIYTAIVAGFIVAMLGGSQVQITGPTAAFATIVAGIVAKEGMDGLIVATIMAGIIILLMGICKLGNLIRYIPYTITTGFTLGIAVTIVIGQLKDFFGLTFRHATIETMGKLAEAAKSIQTCNIQALGIGLLSIAILILLPKINEKIPPSLIAVIVGIALCRGFHLNVNTIGSLYVITNKLPSLALPNANFAMIKHLLPDAFTIGILAVIESLLSCVVSDGMVGGKHDSNTELAALGIGNIFCALFGGIPATGAIARTAANVKNGGKTPIAGMIHAVVLVLILIIFTPYAALIPMPTIAAILFMVAYHMSGWRTFLELVKTSPKSDSIVLVITFALTVIFDLVIAIEVGIVLAAFLFIKRMADVTKVHSWTYIGQKAEINEEKQEQYTLKKVPQNTLVYEIWGPMFFAATDKFLEIPTDETINTIILRMKSVPAMDISALRSLQKIKERCDKNEIHLLFSHVQTQPMSVMQKAGFADLIGMDNFCTNIDCALKRAGEI